MWGHNAHISRWAPPRPPAPTPPPPDGRITRTSAFARHPLDQPLPGPREASLAAAGTPNFFLFTSQLGAQNLRRPHRLIGYQPGSSSNSCSDFKLSDACDAVLFLRQATAATPLR